MSFIHLEKSVVTLHFKEMLEDGHFGGPLTLVGLGALLVGPKLLSSLSTTTPPATQTQGKAASSYRPGMSLSEWVAQAKQQQEAGNQSNHQALSWASHSQSSDRRVA